MNTLTGLLLFLLGAFGLVILFMSFPQIQYYTGGAVIALFIAGLIYAWGNTIRQTRKLEETQKAAEKPVASG